MDAKDKRMIVLVAALILLAATWQSPAQTQGGSSPLAGPQRARPPEAVATQPAPAEPTEAPPPGYNLLTSKKLLGDWGGVRTDLEKIGLSFAPMLYSGYTHNYRGGLNTHNAHDVPGVAQYNLETDFDKMGLVPGGSFFIRGLQSWNNGVRADVGSLSTPAATWASSGDNEILVDKWWWRQRFLDNRVEIRLGKLLNIVDLFDANLYAGNQYVKFTNSFLAWNPTIPVTKGIGAFAKVWPADWLYFQAGAMDPDQRPTRTGFDTAFHGPCHFRGFWEFGLKPNWFEGVGLTPGNYRFGWWYDPQTKVYFRDTLGGARRVLNESGDMGFYFNFDQLVWKENSDPQDLQGLGIFGRYGYAHGDVNRIEHFWSVGTQYAGLLPDRDKDVIGFGVAQAIMSRQFRSEINSRADRETVYEMYYAIEVTPWLLITPDIQVITNPGGMKDARDALVGNLKVKIAF